jgi:hypothetical protein
MIKPRRGMLFGVGRGSLEVDIRRLEGVAQIQRPEIGDREEPD